MLVRGDQPSAVNKRLAIVVQIGPAIDPRITLVGFTQQLSRQGVSFSTGEDIASGTLLRGHITLPAGEIVRFQARVREGRIKAGEAGHVISMEYVDEPDPVYLEWLRGIEGAAAPRTLGSRGSSPPERRGALRYGVRIPASFQYLGGPTREAAETESVSHDGCVLRTSATQPGQVSLRLFVYLSLPSRVQVRILGLVIASKAPLRDGERATITVQFQPGEVLPEAFVQFLEGCSEEATDPKMPARNSIPPPGRATPISGEFAAAPRTAVGRPTRRDTLEFRAPQTEVDAARARLLSERSPGARHVEPPPSSIEGPTPRPSPADLRTGRRTPVEQPRAPALDDLCRDYLVEFERTQPPTPKKR